MISRCAQFSKLMETSTPKAGSGATGPLVLSEQALEEALVLVDEGLSRWWRDTRKRGVMRALCERVQDQAQMTTIVGRLVDRGFRALRGHPHEQADLFHSASYRQALDDTLVGREIAGQGLRTKQEGNFYHAVAAFTPWNFDEILGRVNLDEASHPQADRARVDWLLAGDFHGDTPLHVLWSPTALGRALIGHGSSSERVDVFNQHCLNATLIAMNLGASLLTPNRQGVTALSGMVQRTFTSVDKQHQDTLEEILARILTEELQVRTAPAPVLRRSGMRL